jgi:hypothetical protein
MCLYFDDPEFVAYIVFGDCDEIVIKSIRIDWKGFSPAFFRWLRETALRIRGLAKSRFSDTKSRGAPVESYVAKPNCWR